MKIRDLTITVVDADWRDWVFVQLFTDEGLTGVGEATLEGYTDALVEALRTMRAYLFGQNPFEIERHWQTLFQARFWRGPVWLSALGAVEMALWDIVGKALETPVMNLLGGAVRQRVRAYTHVSEGASGHSVTQRAEEARQAVSEGWTALKWDPLPRGASSLNHRERRIVVEQVCAVREAVGEDIDLLIELHGRLDPESAIRLAAELEPYHPYFLEEPVPPESLDALAQVAAHVRVPLATGERLLTVQAYWPLLERQLVHYIQPDVIHVGGLLPCRKIAALAEARYIEVAPHNPNGPVATAAALHLAAVLPNLAILELAADDYLWGAQWRDEVLVDPTPLHARGGYLDLPTRPGLGVDLNMDGLRRHPPKVRQWETWFETRVTEVG